MAEELDDTEMEVEQAWGSLLTNGNGANGKEVHAEESFERGDAMDGVEATGDIRGVGMSSWWKKPNGALKEKEKGKEGEGEGEVEVDKEREIEMVTERMIENANANSTPDIMMAEDAVKRERIADEVTAAA